MEGSDFFSDGTGFYGRPAPLETIELRWATAHSSGRFLVALVHGTRMNGSWANVDEAVADLTLKHPNAAVLLPPVA